MRINNNSQGSAGTVRIGSRSISRDALIIGCLGLLNIILFFIAVVIGIYCGNVSEMSASEWETSQALILDVNHEQTMLSKALGEQEEAEQLLREVQRFNKQQTANFKQNATVTDVLQIQLEGLQEEKRTLDSNTSHFQASCRHCLPGWYLYNTSCYFHSKLESLDRRTWQDSREHCQQHGATLTVIDDASEQLTVHENLLNSEDVLHGSWIGLSKVRDQWIWENNVTQQNEGYWRGGQPINTLGLEQCASISNIRDPWRAWASTPCHTTLYWICEKDVVSG